MADLSKTISNSINCFGPYQTQKWGGAGLFPMVWGVSKWAEGAMYTQKDQLITVSNTLTYDSSIYKNVIKLVSVTLDTAMETGSETLQSTNGYFYVFRKPSSNAEDRPTNTYTELSPTTVSYSSLTATSTTWS